MTTRSPIAPKHACSTLRAPATPRRHMRRFAGALLASLLCLPLVGCASDGDLDDASVASDDDSIALDPAARKAAIDDALLALPDARVLSVGKDGVPKFVRGSLGRVDVAAVPEETDLRAALAPIAPVFRLRPEALTIRSASRDERGATHFRLSQTRNGLPVYGAELIVHVKDGVIEAVNGRAPADLPAPTEPAIDAADAMAAAVSAMPELVELTSRAGEEAPKLAYHLDGDALRLVFAVEVSGRAESGQPIADTVLVDAIDGAMRLRMPHIHTAKNRNVYNANHTTSLPGTLVRSEGSAPVPSDPILNDNYNRLGSTYDCYYSLFTRDAWNGGGATIKSSVHYGSVSSDINNAFWNGSQLAFGDGDGTTYNAFGAQMDVVAHEFTHAVTQYESNLTYSGESGGLNEAMSDIFGAVCEWWTDGQVLSSDTWKVGEDAYIAGDALRYMNDPAADGASLDHYADWYSGVDVHYSSGIANLAFYLLTVGGTHPRGQTTTSVTGVGMLKAAKIFYLANTNYLISSSNYADARTATVAAAEALYDAATAISVSQAWDAVGVIREDFSSSVVPGTGSWGSWREDAYCPDGTWATGYALRVEGGQGSGDDTALNSVRLYCSNSAGTKTTSITSYDGLWGSWGSTSSCASGSFLKSAKMRIEGSQGGGDDTAANNVTFSCTNGAEITASNGSGWGSWGSYVSCPSGTAVCGLSIRFESNQGSGDDTAMNGLELHCCNL